MSAAAETLAAPRSEQSGLLASWPTFVGYALLAMGIAGYLFFTLPQLSRPLVYDDANFAFAATAVAQTGLPFGNQAYLGFNYDYSQREQWALWHPPLYIYLLGLWAKLFGNGPAALHSLGAIAGLIGGALTFLLAQRVTAGARPTKVLAGGVAAVLTLFSPIYVQSALILDIDFTLLTPMTLGFLWLYFRVEDRSWRRWWPLIPLFALTLWAKMTNPMPLLAALAAWQVLRGKFLRAVVHVGAIALAGGAIFGLTWLLASLVLGFPLDRPFAVNAGQWADSAEVASRAYVSVNAFIAGLQITVIWLGPALVALVLLVGALRAGHLVTSWGLRRTDLLLGLALILIAGYINKSAGWFPKYQVVLLPLLACVAAPFLATTIQRWPRLSALLAALGAAGTLAVVLTTVRDDWAVNRWYTLPEDSALALLAIFVLATSIGLAFTRHTLLALVVLAGMSLGWNVGVERVINRVPYTTTYWYGTRGIAEATAWTDANVPPGELYVASKEIAYASKSQLFVDQESLVYYLDTLGTFRGEWLGSPIRVVVAWVREPYINHLLEERLPPLGYREVERFGDYVVYVR